MDLKRSIDATELTHRDLTMSHSRRRFLGGVTISPLLLTTPGGKVMSYAPSWQMPATQSYRIIEHQWIPMPDKVRLSARAWIPDSSASTPVPVVLEYIPYRKRDAYRFHDNAWGEALASRGIAFARVDVRGSGDSEGVLTDEYTETELDDGVQCIDWLSRQLWCNGNVGMRGISWGAINALQIAAIGPPALKAILPIAGTDNRFTDDAHYIGGTLAAANLQWGLSFKSVMAAPPDPAIVGDAWQSLWMQRLKATPAIITRWLKHQRHDDYWQRGSIDVDYAAIRCPVYVVAGWQDTYANPVGRLLAQLKGPRKGLVGPWGHTYPEMAAPGGIDWAFEEVRWWRQWLLGEDTGIMREPMFHAFMPYQTPRQSLPEPIPGRWIAESNWPPQSVTGRRLYLGAQGAGFTPPIETTRRSIPSGSPVGLTRPEWLNSLPVVQNDDDDHSLVFDSEPLKEDLEILGYPMVRLRVSCDRPVATLAVRLNEVAPGGESFPLTYLLRNLTHRDSHRSPEALAPGRIYDVSIPMLFTAHRFKRGHRIRIALSEGLWPMTVPAPEPAVLTLELSAPGTDESLAAENSIELPVRQIEPIPRNLPIPTLDQSADRPPVTADPPGLDSTGWYNYRTSQPSRSYTDPDTGTELSSESSEAHRLKPGSASSAVLRQRRGFRRGDWQCEIEVECELNVSKTTFRIRESLKAYQDDTLIFERESDETIERDLM